MHGRRNVCIPRRRDVPDSAPAWAFSPFFTHGIRPCCSTELRLNPQPGLNDDGQDVRKYLLRKDHMFTSGRIGCPLFGIKSDAGFNPSRGARLRAMATIVAIRYRIPVGRQRSLRR